MPTGPINRPPEPTLTSPIKWTPCGSKLPAPAFGTAAVAVAIERDLRIQDIVLARHIVGVEPACEMICAASSNYDGLDRCVMSPVWIMNDGFAGIVAMRPITSSNVPLVFGLTGSAKPMWLPLIRRKLRPPNSCAIASSTKPSECSAPPVIVHSTPMPAQVMHFSSLRRL